MLAPDTPIVTFLPVPNPHIALLGNLVNVSYAFAKALAAHGVHATYYPSDNEWPGRDPVTGVARPDSPFNEDAEPDRSVIGRPYSMHFAARAWRKIGFDLGLPFLADLWRLLDGVDLIQAQATSATWAAAIKRYRGTPFIAMTAGADLSELAFENSYAGRKYRSALLAADHVLLANVAQWRLAERVGLDLARVSFMPFAIDCERFTPAPPPHRDEVVFASATRLDWTDRSGRPTKRNDVFFRGLGAFVARNPGQRIRLHLVDWGVDRAPTRELIDSLGLTSLTVFEPPGDKDRVIDLYRRADVVVDQFLVGSAGMACLEAMAMARPVMIYIDAPMAERSYGEPMPVVNVQTESEVAVAIQQLTDPIARAQIGARARDWVLRHHHFPAVSARLVACYSRILGREVV